MRFWIPVVAVAIVALLALGCAPGAAAEPTSGPARPSSSALPASTFAARAGFAPSHALLAHAVRPSQANLTVDVVFQLGTGTGPSGASQPAVSPLSSGQFAARFGLAPSAFRSAEAYFADQGLAVQPFSSDRLGLQLTGSAAAFGRAFNTNLLAGLNGTRPVVFPATSPSLPAWLESEVAGVVGLSDGFDQFSFSLSPAQEALSHRSTTAALASDLVTPDRARTIYGLSSLYNLTGGPQNATGHGIAVVLWGAGYAPYDIQSFFSQDNPSSFPQPIVRAYPVDGAPSPNNTAYGAADLEAVEELTLDIEWAASMAPGATIDAVYTHDGPPPSYGPSAANLTTAIDTALSLSSTTDLAAISMSFGSSDSGDSSLVSAWQPLFTEADDKGITLLAATGDTGGDTTACSGTPDPQYPSTAPDVIAVGGTSVNITSETVTSTTFTEAAWGKGGGGYSVNQPVPSWQLVGNGTDSIAANGHRGTPDVSASAANDFLYFDATGTYAAGTSFATPLWAGLVAALDAKWGQHLGFFTDRLYHIGANEVGGGIGAGLGDVTTGANCVASAGPAWDAATGWGSPRGAVLYADLLGSFVNISLSANPSPVAPAQSLTVHITVANHTTGAPIADVPVKVTLAADVPTGPCAGAFGSATPTTDARGQASANLTVPFCYLGVHVLVNAQVTTVHYLGANSTRIAVNLLGWFPQAAFLETPPWEYLTYGVIMAAALAGGWGLGRLITLPSPPQAPATAPPPAPPPAPPAAPTAPAAAVPGGPPEEDPTTSPPAGPPPSPESMGDTGGAATPPDGTTEPAPADAGQKS